MEKEHLSDYDLQTLQDLLRGLERRAEEDGSTQTAEFAMEYIVKIAKVRDAMSKGRNQE